MVKHINPLKAVLAISSVLMGMLLPLILYFITGTIEHSISSYHYCPESEEPLFIMLMIISLGFFVGKKQFMISGILLILIAIVNIEYLILHDLIAILFFLYTSTIMAFDKRFNLFALPILISIALLPFGKLYVFEIIGIMSICIYNLLYILRYFRVIHSK